MDKNTPPIAPKRDRPRTKADTHSIGDPIPAKGRDLKMEPGVRREAGIKPLKSLGQNFLIDKSVCDKIVYSIGNIDGDIVLEVGPGKGALTRSILALSRCVKIIAIEKDDRLVSLLKRLVDEETSVRTKDNDVNGGDGDGRNATNVPRLELIHADALQIDYRKLLAGLAGDANANHKSPDSHEGPSEHDGTSNSSILKDSPKKVHIVANLPYNIGTALLFLWLEQMELFTSITIMLQLEVAKRITAKPGSGAYSWLSILSSLLCDNEIIMNIPPESFSPAPKIQSAIVHMRPRVDRLTTSSPHNLAKLRYICRKAFLQRRKKISNSLKGIVSVEQLAAADISPDMRPEEISVEQYCRLSNLL